MINPCPRRILCPPGTGVETSGTNYSAEHHDVREFPAVYYPPTPYGYYTACVGRCISILSQREADLCAQRLGKICLNETTTNKPTFGNNPQICTIAATGKTVIVDAGVFHADSQAEADAQALSFANEQQVNPGTPPGITVVPNDGGGGDGTPPNIVPTPTPPRPRPPAASHCKPCDDSGASGAFSLVCNVPASKDIISFESPPLKCGTWRFRIETNDPGSIDDGESGVTLSAVAANPARTTLTWESVFDCGQIAFVMPCSPGDCTAPRTVLEFGLFPGCCGTKQVDCSYANCETLGDGSRWLVILRVTYATAFPIGNSAKRFTIHGTLLAPLPTPP